jgi:hypothetical protein
MHGVMDIYAQFTSLGGRNVDTHEKSLVVDIPEHEFQSSMERKAVYQYAIP